MIILITSLKRNNFDLMKFLGIKKYEYEIHREYEELEDYEEIDESEELENYSFPELPKLEDEIIHCFKFKNVYQDIERLLIELQNKEEIGDYEIVL